MCDLHKICGVQNRCIDHQSLSAQTTKGFSNWKDATASFKKHLQSKAHGEAVEVVVILPKTTKDVRELLSQAHRLQKTNARDMLRLILSSVRFLARQGLALRGDGSDASANLIQLLRLRAEDKPEVLQWLDKSAHKHTASGTCQHFRKFSKKLTN